MLDCTIFLAVWGASVTIEDIQKMSNDVYNNFYCTSHITCTTTGAALYGYDMTICAKD